MRAHLIVIHRISRKSSPQVRFIEDQHPVQALGLYGSPPCRRDALSKKLKWFPPKPVTALSGIGSTASKMIEAMHRHVSGLPRKRTQIQAYGACREVP
jgi:hypothetical protein